MLLPVKAGADLSAERERTVLHKSRFEPQSSHAEQTLSTHASAALLTEAIRTMTAQKEGLRKDICFRQATLILLRRRLPIHTKTDGGSNYYWKAGSISESDHVFNIGIGKSQALNIRIGHAEDNTGILFSWAFRIMIM